MSDEYLLGGKTVTDDLLKALDRIEKLNPVWDIDGHLGFIPEAGTFSLRYRSAEGYLISMFTRAGDSYSSSISIYKADDEDDDDGIRIYEETFASPFPNSFDRTVSPPWTRTGCCLYLREYSEKVAKPVLEARQEEEKNKN